MKVKENEPRQTSPVDDAGKSTATEASSEPEVSMASEVPTESEETTTSHEQKDAVSTIEDEGLPDLTEIDLRKQMLVPHPKDGETLLAMKLSTPARIGVWRAGPRYKTETYLRFRADHAAAQDAVFSDVSDEFLEANGLEAIQTQCTSKDEFITRPDLGRQFSDDAKKIIEKIAGTSSKVLVYVSDGLSSTAVTTNAMDTMKSITQGLDRHGVSLGNPFFVKYGRVPAMDVISEVTGSEVVCVLIGERPGLVTAESMSAYITYKGTVGMAEARRTVVSNIHAGGTPAVEAGGYIADIIKLMLEKKVSGIDLKL
ncbi:MAG: ethanolamine ammonia-lyase [Dethiosulfovibrio peptidovorans]|nr:MAG: ethanolamine ammonia-lyase [Dethiosulfovibrio peptidovorans]